MTELKRRIKNLNWQLDYAARARAEMILRLDFCPAEAVPILMENIDKADKDLRRLARIRRGLERQLRGE